MQGEPGDLAVPMRRAAVGASRAAPWGCPGGSPTAPVMGLGHPSKRWFATFSD